MISRAKRLILLVCTIAVILTIPIVAAAEAPVYADVAARKAQDMLLVPVLPNDAEEIGRILEQITAGANWPQRAMATLMNLPGQKPAILLNGDQNSVQQAYDILKPYLDLFGTRKLIAVSVDVRMVSVGNDFQLGLNVLQDGVNADVSQAYAKTTITNEVTGNTTRTDTTTTSEKAWANGTMSKTGMSKGSNMLSFKEAWADGRQLISGELYTVSGEAVTLTNNNSFPIVSNSKTSGYTTRFENITTNISLMPVVEKFNVEDITKSQIKLDIKSEVSFVTAIKKMQNQEIPDTTTDMLSTVRVIQADNKPNVVGVLASDIDMKTSSGIPWLKDIPLIGYLFGSETTEKRRVIAVISVAVRIIPAPEDFSSGISDANAARGDKNAK